MKLKTHEAAASLQLHPFDLMLFLAEMDAGFDDIWPEIHQDHVEAVRAQNWHRFHKADGGNFAQMQQAVSPAKLEVGVSARQIIEKLWRRRHWGTHTISIETLRVHHCRHVENLDEAIAELIKTGLLLSHGSDGPYSLNHKKKLEIDRIAETVVNPSH